MYLRMHEWHFAIQLLITIFSVNISLIQRTHRHIPALVFNPACKEMSDFNWKVFTIQKWNLAHGISSQLLDPRPKCHLPTTASSTPDTEHTCEMLIFRVADLREILGAQYNPFSLFSPPPIDEWPLKRVISVAVNYPIGVWLKSHFVHFSLKIWHVTATNFMIILRRNWSNIQIQINA